MKLHEANEAQRAAMLTAVEQVWHLYHATGRKMAAPYGDGTRCVMVNGNDILPALRDILEGLETCLSETTPKTK